MEHTNVNRQKYESPEVTVVRFAIEQGFQASNLNPAAIQQMQGYTDVGDAAWSGSTVPSSGGTVGGFTDGGDGAWN